MNRFIFDVDGTLTPSRQTIDPEFKQWFLSFIKQNNVYLVTGSDYEKTIEQLGKTICENVMTCYNCSGNDIYAKGKNIKSKQFVAPKELYDLMNGWLQGSPFKLRTGNHIEERTGTINFSIVGRNCTLEERKEYVQYDLSYRERETIAHQINSEFPTITASVGGETGIDIYNKGADKSQIMKDFTSDDKIFFFGDKMEQGGNDWPLANKLNSKRCYQVKGWRDTWERLEYFAEARIIA